MIMKIGSILTVLILSAYSSFAEGPIQQPQPEMGELPWTTVNQETQVQIRNFMKAFQEGEKTETGHVPRDAHLKHHGCVKGSIRFFANNLPEKLRVGLFSLPAQDFPIWVRYSNGSALPHQVDSNPDTRGMAVKIMDLPPMDNFLNTNGIEKDQRTADLLMITMESFFIDNGDDYLDFTKAFMGGSKADIVKFFATHPTAYLRVNAGNKEGSKDSLLSMKFFSSTIYKLGPAAARFYIESDADKEFVSDKSNPNFLGSNLKDHLQSQAWKYNLYVKYTFDSKEAEVEKPSREWSKDLPVAKVAEITLQTDNDIASDDRNKFCEEIDFNPWRVPAENRPLGQVNRIRLQSYLDSANRRR